MTQDRLPFATQGAPNQHAVSRMHPDGRPVGAGEPLLARILDPDRGDRAVLAAAAFALAVALGVDLVERTAAPATVEVCRPSIQA